MPPKGGYLPFCKLNCQSPIKVKNQTLKYQKVSETKKLCLNTIKCSNFALSYKKNNFSPKKMHITANLDVILRNASFWQFLIIFLGLKVFSFVK